MASLLIRPALAADIEAFYGFRWRHTMRALVAEHDGEVIGVIGLSREGDHQKLFSDVKSELEPHLRRMVTLRAIKRVMGWVSVSRLPVLAVADNPPLLERLGFRKLSEDIYIWAN